MTTRRQVLLGIGVLAGAAALPGAWRHARAGTPIFFAAQDDGAGRHYLAALDAGGRVRMRVGVPERAHSVAVAPDGRSAVYFARRAGRHAWWVDLASGGITHTLQATEGRHFYGHGAFSPDGRRLYTTENDYAQARGVIAVLDGATGARLAEFDSAGTGPHDLRLMPDGKTLVVANGGMATHPDSGREILNIASMQPSLAYLNRADGALLEQVQPPHHLLSVRHLWVAPDGLVGVAMQYQGPATDRQPLVAFHRRGQLLRTALAPIATQREMDAYTASICVDTRRQTAVVTCPRGDLVTLWDTRHAAFRAAHRLADASGANLSPDGDGFVITTGTGRVGRLRAAGGFLALSRIADTRWDNHLIGRAG